MPGVAAPRRAGLTWGRSRARRRRSRGRRCSAARSPWWEPARQRAAVPGTGESSSPKRHPPRRAAVGCWSCRPRGPWGCRKPAGGDAGSGEAQRVGWRHRELPTPPAMQGEWASPGSQWRHWSVGVIGWSMESTRGHWDLSGVSRVAVQTQWGSMGSQCQWMINDISVGSARSQWGLIGCEWGLIGGQEAVSGV